LAPNNYENILITAKAYKVFKRILTENPRLEKILKKAHNADEAMRFIREWVMEYFDNNPEAFRYYKNQKSSRKLFETLKWRDYAAIRILDYIDNAGRIFEDLNLEEEVAISNPFKVMWMCYHNGTGGANRYFFEDMLMLFRQFSGKLKRNTPSRRTLIQWMKKYPSGTEEEIVRLREINKDRIINALIKRIDKIKSPNSKYHFKPEMSHEIKYQKMLEWWNEHTFHLKFAVRTPEMLNELLNFSLDEATMKLLKSAKKAGIPFFVNPYYLSLLNVTHGDNNIASDLAIRDYVIYSEKLISEFGRIVAWEKEDKVTPGEPNAAGWILPSDHNMHRRYPEVAILIPDTVGRACGGLCVSCQRMYDFQSGNLNFDLDKLRPRESWDKKLVTLMKYYENDSQLRDILITGGDGLMSSDKSLDKILESVYNMAKRKIEANKKRPNGEKYAELLRVRIGSRMLAYLPQRITPSLTNVLRRFKEKATQIGVKQFVIQSHFESPMEITPEAVKAIKMIQDAGWIVTNQLVFTAAVSRRGHTAKLRKVLNENGVLPYYNFTVKGYQENSYNFATNARAVQEQMEEKVFGTVPSGFKANIKKFTGNASRLAHNLNTFMKKTDLPFLATDRNVLNLPGVGKSLTFKVIGITRYGRRILEFNHDHTRNHSPIIHKMGKVTIVESKSMTEYLKQITAMGENIAEYESVFGYSIGETEPRMTVYEYPEYNFETTSEITNLKIE